MSGPSGKITTFRLFDCDELVRDVRDHLVDQRDIAEIVEHAANPVSRFFDAHVGLKKTPP
ncbi:hypothetical protein [Amycolatopsis sp. YIM 10]|uniref:hypothetical protein n=1 Tax=Amycolatopsis sp. YIM 10 TaxID=2653857 RepID=UPI0012A8E4F3|nr:hypothetical protein [Amycolatopsis sp. YIM 10]QFU86114.1 hypothetical protein YIM_04470 [Amycolatopsis sp. YIM 10]